ncbi:MAG: TatD family hydrolase [Luteolibacter sp.]|jgi:TatD DNase family protein|nr:TatD family hydrolase [Luteolibacter sp.]
MLTDSHCHLASHRFQPGELPALIGSARAVGVDRLVTLATSLGDLPANLSIADTPCVHTCIGIHPCDVHHAPDNAIDQLAAFTADPRVCAIGETGLDYYHPAPDGWEEGAFRARQMEFLRWHFQLAAAAGLNIVIHTRDQEGRESFEDALGIYKEFHRGIRAVFHCFIGTWEDARRVLQLGGLVSFGGVATFKNAREIRDTVLKCPPGSFMVETDAPYLAPQPHRGKRNEPAFVRDTADFLAALRGETPAELARHTSDTASAFFRFRSAGN